MLNKRFLDDANVFATGLWTTAAYVALHGLIREKTPPLLALPEYLPSVGIIVFALMFALSQRGFSSLSFLARPIGVAWELAVGYFLALVAYAFVAYALRMTHLSRLFLVGGAALGWAAACAWHLSLFAARRWLAARGWGVKRVLLVGDEQTLPEMERMLRDSSFGLLVAGTLRLSDAGGIRPFLDAHPVDYALFTTHRGDPEAVEGAMLACSERGIQVWLKPDFMERACSGMAYLNDVPLLVFSMTPREGPALVLKRAVDLAAAALLLVLLAAPMLAVALLIRCTSRGPALLSQRRIGLNGCEFDMYKFRSMYDETREYELRNEMRGPAFKMRRDPRVTPLGRLLRKYSIDELPQLWNVIRGEMSLVGPRPPLPSEVRQYHGWQRRRLSMRPGITGLWQVSGRNALDFDDWVALDLKYIDGWSLWLDLEIMLRTIPAVLKGTGV